MSLLKQLSGFFSSAEPYSYEIKEGTNEAGATVYVVCILLPDTGWVYTQGGGYVDNSIRWARKYTSRADAERAAQEAATIHRELDQEKNVTWK